jgi:hypothetical protein
MDINKLWEKYTTNEYTMQSWYKMMTKENFAKAIAEIISIPVDCKVIVQKSDIDALLKLMATTTITNNYQAIKFHLIPIIHQKFY